MNMLCYIYIVFWVFIKINYYKYLYLLIFLFHLVINIPIFSYNLIWTCFILKVISHKLQYLALWLLWGLLVFLHYISVVLNVIYINYHLYFYVSAYKGFSSNSENISLHLFPVFCFVFCIMISVSNESAYVLKGRQQLISLFKMWTHGIQKVICQFHFLQCVLVCSKFFVSLLPCHHSFLCPKGTELIIAALVDVAHSQLMSFTDLQSFFTLWVLAFLVLFILLSV